MQALFPTTPSALSHDDLVELYAYPHERFWVRANFVATLDGAAQGSDDKSGTLSSEYDKQVFGVLRTLCDVVLVGAGTTRTEGYQPVQVSEVDSAVRSRLGLAPVPTIAVVSRSLELDPALVEGGRAPTVLVTTESSPSEVRREVEAATPVIVAGDHDVDFRIALDALAALGFQRILCEGGPHLMRSLLASGRLDELCLTITPLIVAGDRLRIAEGPSLTPPQSMRLRHLLEADGELFARYTRGA